MAAAELNALVLRTFEYSENSQVAQLFTREQGRIHGIAKGARRLKGAFHGGLDSLQLGKVGVYARKPTASLRTLSSFRVQTPFPGIRERLSAFDAAEHIRALLLGFLREEQEDEALFDLTVAALRMLDVAEQDQAAALAIGFEAMLLAHTGFAPQLTCCVRCEKPARNVRTARLSVLRGGLLCSACRGEDPGAREISGRGVATLVTLSSGPLVRAAQLPSDRELRREVLNALDAWTSNVLDRRLPTRAGLR